MQLRKVIKPPKRYSDEVSDFDSNDEIGDEMPSAASPSKTPKKIRTKSVAERAKDLVQFNPNVRPAAFPTLEWPETFEMKARAPSSDHDPDSQAIAFEGAPSTNTLPSRRSSNPFLRLRLSPVSGEQRQEAGTSISHRDTSDTDKNLSSSSSRHVPTSSIVSPNLVTTLRREVGGFGSFESSIIFT